MARLWAVVVGTGALGPNGSLLPPCRTYVVAAPPVPGTNPVSHLTETRNAILLSEYGIWSTGYW